MEFTDQVYARVDNPLKRPAEISYSNEEITEPYFVDRSKNGPDGKGKHVTNSAGDPFEQYFERENGRMVITVTVNEAAHDPVIADSFSHSVNKDAVVIDGTTYAAGTLKLSPIAATKVAETVSTDGVSQRFPEGVTCRRHRKHSRVIPRRYACIVSSAQRRRAITYWRGASSTKCPISCSQFPHAVRVMGERVTVSSVQ